MPVYNEEDLITIVVKDWLSVLPNNSSKLLVINDGSNDNTLNLLEKLSITNENLKIMNNPNQGHGMAVINGYKYAVKNQFNFIFQIDSDNQFNVTDFQKLWSLRENNFNLILGIRKNRNDPLLRVLLSKIFLRTLILILFQKYISDANIPFRLIKLKLLEDFLEFSKQSMLAPNILLSIFSKKTKSINVVHLPRKNQEDFSWSLKKIYLFGIALIKELINFRFKLLKF